MDQTRTTDKLDAGQEAIAAAILKLGEASAAALAEAAGIAYSTTNKKLRLLEAARRAEAFKGTDGRTLWRSTAAPPTDPTDADDAADVPAPSTEPDVEPEPTEPEPTEPDTVEDAEAAPPPDTDSTDAHTQRTDDATETSECGVPTPANTVHGRDDDEATDTDVSAASDGDASTAAGDSIHGDTDTAVAEPDAPAAAAATAEDTGSTEPVAPDTDAEAPVADSGEEPNVDPCESAGPATAEAAAGGSDPVQGPVDASPPAVDANGSAAGARRRPGALIESIRTIMRANPDTTYRVGQLCKLIDQANEGTGARKASAGAVKNQLDKLGGKGEIVMVAEHPATFQLATT